MPDQPNTEDEHERTKGQALGERIGPPVTLGRTVAEAFQPNTEAMTEARDVWRKGRYGESAAECSAFKAGWLARSQTPSPPSEGEVERRIAGLEVDRIARVGTATERMNDARQERDAEHARWQRVENERNGQAERARQAEARVRELEGALRGMVELYDRAESGSLHSDEIDETLRDARTALSSTTPTEED